MLTKHQSGMVLSFHRCCVSHLTASKPFSIIALPHYSSSHAQSPVPRPISAAAGTRKRGRCFPTLGRGKTAGAAPSAVPSSIRPTPKPCHLACPKAWTPSVPRPLVQTRIRSTGYTRSLATKSTSSLPLQTPIGPCLTGPFSVKLWSSMPQLDPFAE